MVYMPCVASLVSSISADGDTSESHAEDIPLFLPSSLPAILSHDIRTTGLTPGLMDTEKRLRLAQADDALAEVRDQRRTLTGLVIFKKLNVSGTGQKANTRVRTLFKRFNNKTVSAAERYRSARRALEVLDPDGDWKVRLQVLKPEDIRGPGREEIDTRERRPDQAEKRREPSWIWLVPRSETGPDATSAEEHLDAHLRVEWAKARARAMRWAEEVDLLLEEMRRTLAFLEWKASWWRGQKTRRSNEPAALAHGLSAYAERQAALHEQIAASHARYWLPALNKKGIKPSWQAKYSQVTKTVSEADRGDTEGEEEEEGDADDVDRFE